MRLRHLAKVHTHQSNSLLSLPPESSMFKYLISILCLFPASTSFATDRPNVIVILTDDQGYGDMGCHGNPWLKTPNLDRLAAESVQLEDYHVDPICTPTRAALMTGRYCTRVGAWDVIQGRQLLQSDETTMADIFERSGYRTGMFGKWHLGDAWPYATRFRGFQTVVRHLAGGTDEISNPSDNDFFDDTYYHNGKPKNSQGYCTDVFFNELHQFISRDSDQPFFAYLPLNAMHSPHTVAEKYSAPFEAMGHPEKRSKFYGMIINFDENLGRLFEVMQEHNLNDNTILVFMGDNGTAEGNGDPKGSGVSIVHGNPINLEAGFNSGMRGAKGSTYEGGHRVACFARWPGKWEAGKQVHQLTSHRDWLPTFIDVCGLQRDQKEPFDGQSIAPLLVSNLGQDAQAEAASTPEGWPDRTLFIQRQSDTPVLGKRSGNGHNSPSYAILTEKWRMVDGALYDHASDPGQNHDVAADHPDVVEELYQNYQQHFADVFAEGQPFARFQIGGQENPTQFTVRDWHPVKTGKAAGRVIWQQSQLGDDSIFINGFWAINVIQPGRYQIRLTRHPDDAPDSMKATVARLQIGDQILRQTISPDATSVQFEMDLPMGPARLQGWLTDQKTGKDRGAYFVNIRLHR